MIVTELKSSAVETNTGTTATRFKIKASARAFQILSGFYSDPVAAIPRELGANAWDAHVKAKTTDRQFEVHVPNTLEPWFCIRDFGTGLAPKDIDTIYTTYFESTKTNDNDSDGCMGLGSKTPFNYTENFTVTSWFAGIKSTYNCFIDEAGGPSIIKLASEPSDDHNGVSVKFAVKQDDISTFVNKIRQSYLPFRNRPKLVGIHDIKFPEIKYEFTGTNWAMHANTDRHTNGNQALMGNYSYPISSAVYGWNSCKGVTSDELSEARQLLQNAHFDFQFAIGDLDVAPNKEQLQYDVDDRTRSAIIKRAIVAKRELHAQVMATLKPTTRWEAMQLYWMYNSYNNPIGQDIRRILGTINVPFNGTIVESSEVSLRNVFRALSGNKEYDASKEPSYSVRMVNFNAMKNRFKFTNSSDQYRVTNKTRTIIFYTDQANLKKSRVRKYLTETFPNDNGLEFMLITDVSTGFKTMWEHQKYLGIPSECFIHVESLPKPVVIRTNVSTKSSVVNGVYSMPTSYIEARNPYINFNLHTLAAQSTETYYYVPMFYTNSFIGPMDGPAKKILTDHQLGGLLYKAIELKIIPSDVKHIYGINKKTINILTTGKWVNIIEALQKKITGKETARIEQLLASIGFRAALHEHTNKIAHVIRDNSKFLSQISSPETDKLLKFVNILGQDHSALSTSDGVAVDIFSIKAKMHTAPEYSLAEVTKLFNGKYMGLFNLISTYDYDHTNLVKLINFIDKNS